MDTNQDKLKLTSVNDLMGMNFYIPTYQRGYRWKDRQVFDLLDDLWEFYLKEKKPNEIYCVQPLVVKRKEEDTFRKIKEEAANLSEIASLLKGYWEVIDGQQRLTTFYIILAYLCPELPHKFQLEYATRNPDDRSPEYGSIGSKEFLKQLDQNEINEEIADSNIDFYHMRNTYNVVRKWVSSKKLKEANEAYNLEGFIDTLMHRVKFIWYETDEPDPIAVFIRLNIGKISLTDSELIKALFLNESNFTDSADGIRLQQIEIATEWDQIEKTLRGDEFWLFIHDLKWDKPTRIEWIFDMIVERQLFGEIPDCGDDNHKIFRYFYEYFNRNKECINSDWIRVTWNKVKNYFMIFQEWYNDFELYHYIGYLVHLGTPVEQIIKRYENSSGKADFKRFLKNISFCIPAGKITAIVGASGSGKSTLFKLLLGFYKPILGEIKIDNIDLHRVNIRNWRGQCSVIMQGSYIFNDTIENNINLTEEDTDYNKLEDVVRFANLYDVIYSLPKKYQTIIGKEGHGLSGGQLQRLLIARALYKESNYIFLDEFTNSLDAHNEMEIIEKLQKRKKKKTIVIIAHRFSTIKNADQIIAISDGTIKEIGKHEELMNKRGIYYKLMKDQIILE